MPVNAVIPALIGSIVGGAAQEIASVPGPGSPVVPEVAIPRMLPQGTAKGEFAVLGPANAEVDGKPMLLAPGVQIRDPFNMVVFPAMIQRPVPVRYLTDPAGAINRVWILSAQEAAQP